MERSLLTINQSIDALRSGLSFVSKEIASLFWASVQIRLAGSYLERAELEDMSGSLEAAQDHISQALSILGPGSVGTLTEEALEWLHASKR